MQSQSNFVIIGAGPKALAVVAKAFVLNKFFKFEIPIFHIIERREIAANWTGKNGFTNGRLRLGTSPQKDIGFPYQSQFFGDERDHLLNQEMRRFSWDTYLVSSGRYAQWIDRGKPNPTHSEWANYLKYGFSLVSEAVKIHQGELDEISNKGESLKITYLNNHQRTSIEASSLMLTGPGESTAKIPFGSKRIFDINSYWKSKTNFKENEKVLIIGGGENSATIALDINQRYADKGIEINILTPSGTILSRGESYFENKVYTNAKDGHWEELSLLEKRSFIKHTDLGVYSVDAMNELSQSASLNILKGFAEFSTEINNRVIVSLRDKNKTFTYNRVIWATGFQKVGLLKSKLSEDLKDELQESLGELSDRNLETQMGSDLAIKKINYKIFLPMISGLNNGPGFSNLSSLGSLADKILYGLLQKKMENIYAISN